MTKAELIETLANKLPMNKAEAEKAINIVLEDVITALKQGQRVNISGFGTFSVSDRQARTGPNPKTGESIQISASRSAKFKPGKQLKDSLNEGFEGAPAASRFRSTLDDLRGRLEQLRYNVANMTASVAPHRVGPAADVPVKPGVETAPEARTSSVVDMRA